MEERAHAGQHLPAVFERLNGVLEGRRGRVGGDRLEVISLELGSRDDSCLQVPRRAPIQRWQATQRALPGIQQRLDI